jgi:hypothetical protein
MAREEEICSNRQNRLDGCINKWGNVTGDLYGRCGSASRRKAHALGIKAGL